MGNHNEDTYSIDIEGIVRDLGFVCYSINIVSKTVPTIIEMIREVKQHIYGIKRHQHYKHVNHKLEGVLRLVRELEFNGMLIRVRVSEGVWLS